MSLDYAKARTVITAALARASNRQIVSVDAVLDQIVNCIRDDTKPDN